MHCPSFVDINLLPEKMDSLEVVICKYKSHIILLSEPSIILFLILITSLSYFLKASDIPHNTHNFQKGRIPGALEILPPYIPLKEVLIYTPAESDIEFPLSELHKIF